MLRWLECLLLSKLMCNTIYLYSWSNLPDAITIASSRVIVFDNSISVIFLL